MKNGNRTDMGSIGEQRHRSRSPIINQLQGGQVQERQGRLTVPAERKQGARSAVHLAVPFASSVRLHVGEEQPTKQDATS